MGKREDYIAQRMDDMEGPNNGLQFTPTLLGLLAIVVLFVGQPVGAALLGGCAVLLSIASAKVARVDAEVAVDAYMTGEGDNARLAKHYGLGCALGLFGIALIVATFVAFIGLSLADPWVTIGGPR